MTPNGDPMFRGSQFNSRINGGQTRATENFFDGGAFGYASGHQQSQESAPPVESIEEVTVVTTTYSAQYGHTSGGFIEYTSKSGTNKLHGTAYGYLAKDSLNTQGFFKLPKTPLDNKNWGATVGGPIIKNKTFFFLNADWTQFRSGTLEGFGNTTPIDAFKNGDFSALLTGQQIGVDVLGRPDPRGPDLQSRAPRAWSTACRCATPTRATSSPPTTRCGARSPSRYAALMVRPDRPGISNNVAGNPAGDQTWELDARNILLRLDHTFSPKFKAMFSGYYNNRPSVRNCGGAQGCAVTNDPLTDSASNTDYIGEGFTQRIYTTHAHTQWDWIISNNLMSHSVVAWDRWYMGGASLSAGANWPERMWGSQRQSGLVIGDAGPPRMAFAGNTPVQRRRPGLAVLRLREERPLAVLHRPGLDQGQEHVSRSGSSTGTTSSRTRAGPWAAPPATSTSTGSARAATTPRATTSPRPATPSRRSCSGRCTRPTRRSTPSPPGTRATSRRGSTPSSRSTASSP